MTKVLSVEAVKATDGEPILCHLGDRNFDAKVEFHSNGQLWKSGVTCDCCTMTCLCTSLQR